MPALGDLTGVSTPNRAALVRAFSWMGAGHVIGQAFWFGSLLVLAALLPPSAFGTVALGLLLVTAATRLMEAGTRGSIIIADRLTREQLRSCLEVNLIVGLALGGGIALLATPVSELFAGGNGASALRALGLSVEFFAPAIVPLALLERQLEFKRRASVQAAATIIASVLAVVVGLLGGGVWALVVRQVMLQALLAVFGWAAAWKCMPSRVGTGGRLFRGERLARRGAGAFLLFSLTDFVVFNADFLTVG